MRLDRSRRRHPQHRSVGELARDSQQAGPQRRHDDRDRVRWWNRSGPSVRTPVLAGEVDGLAPQCADEDADVLVGTPTGMVVGETEDPSDERLVGWADPEREAGTSHGVDHRRGAVRLQKRMTGVRLQHRSAELDPRRLTTGQRHGDKRVAGDRTRVPERREAVRLGLLRLAEHLVGRRTATGETYAHPSMLYNRTTRRAE